MKNLNIFVRLIRSRPLLCAALMYLVGCIIACNYFPSAKICLAAFCVLILPAIILRNKRIAAALLAIAFLPLGGLRFMCAWNRLEPLPDQQKAVLSGRIAQTPVWNEETERTICVLEHFSIDDIAQDGKIRLYLRGDIEKLKNVRLGQEIQCTAHIWEADGSTNPGQFNFSNHLRLLGLRGYATAKIEDAAFSEAVYTFRDWPERIRASVSQHIERLFPNNSALAHALLLGDKSGLTDEDRESYSKSGAAHILAISGMHVSLLAVAVTMLLGRFLHRKYAYLITCALLFAYGLLIGFTPSLLRAVLMFIIFEGAPVLGRYSDSPTRLASAMLFYLLIRPIAVLENSFILSYGASAGIVLLHGPLKRLFSLKRRIEKRTDVGLFSFFTRRVPQLILDSLVVTLAAQLAILPAVVHMFGSQPLWSFAVNLIAVPLAMCAYLLSIAGTVLCAWPITYVADFLFGLLTGCVRFFGKLPFAAVGIARFPAWLVIICAVLCFLASDMTRINDKIRRFLPFGVVVAVFVSNICAMTTTRGCSIVFLDAGEADCAVIRTEGRVYLVDTGDDYSPAADYITAMNYDVDGIFLSHPHADHAGGLTDILEVCTPEKIYISPNWQNCDVDDGVWEAVQAAQNQGSELFTVHAGDILTLSDKTFLEVLHPAAGIPVDSANEDSMVLRLQYGNRSAVFAGDLPANQFPENIGNTDILKIAHHGAKDSVNSAMLSQLSPSVAVIPTGYNFYGHPHENTIHELNESGAQIYRTDLHGAVTCRLNPDGSVAVQTHVFSEDANGVE